MNERKNNPLLRDAASGPPPFGEIVPEDVEPGIQAIVSEVEKMLETLESEGTPSWEGVVEPLERMHDRLGFGWGIVEHLMSVQNSPALREAYERVEPRVVEISMRIGQSPSVYRALVALRDSDGAKALDPAQQRILTKLVQDAELAGVGLEGEKR